MDAFERFLQLATEEDKGALRELFKQNRMLARAAIQAANELDDLNLETLARTCGVTTRTIRRWFDNQHPGWRKNQSE